MSNPLDITYVDKQTPTINASWLNAVGQTVSGDISPFLTTATAGQTVFTVPNTKWGHVYVGGVYQIPNTSYTRTNDTTITFSEAVPTYAQVVVT